MTTHTPQRFLNNLLFLLLSISSTVGWCWFDERKWHGFCPKTRTRRSENV